ncbi:MAG: tRNA (adenosine(37)-N6)-threonylcarbamoyltransferase complex dimerization subunit type 1 TsaB [Leptospiraceae bacterium]|nr:tRNA (adenosine(37)-N6)-threonylcarbamoyltransferase complex dimerization subunit type 1 TsaB [Leptospiraceae bacterium]MCP5510648.1 tRNA (adenosine(37)-N6)-threonylcarbamoyltransferase complex dimerization subunit type 1 TsaB [Leptospiraceae bacterium]
MNLLYFDTITDWITIGIYSITESGVQELTFYQGRHPREAGNRLVTDIASAMKNRDIEKVDQIFVPNGPGSFTGIRITVSTARNFSQIWKIPVSSCNTIELYSYYYFQKLNRPSLILLDARMGKVYAGMYSGNGFSGVRDIPPSEVKNEFSLNDCEIISDFDFPHSQSIHLDYPSPRMYLSQFQSKFLSLDYNTNHYEGLLPNYMRGTYADGIQHEKKYSA